MKTTEKLLDALNDTETASARSVYSREDWLARNAAMERLAAAIRADAAVVEAARKVPWWHRGRPLQRALAARDEVE